MIWSFCNNSSQYFDCEFLCTRGFLMHALFVASDKVMCTLSETRNTYVINLKHLLNVCR